MEVMVGAGILGGLGLAMMFLIKQQGNLSNKSQVDADLAQVKSQIVNLVTNPANCNANFRGRAVGSTATVNGIFECKRTSGNSKCANPLAAADAEYLLNAVPETNPGIAINDTNWPVVQTGVPKLVNNKNLKISKITSTINSVDSAVCTNAMRCLTNVSITVDFSEKILKADTSTNPASVIVHGKKLNPMTFNSVVITDGVTVLGCPKSWNSTVLY